MASYSAAHREFEMSYRPPPDRSWGPNSRP